MREYNNILRLYAVTDRAWLGEQTLCEQAEQALRGGVTLLQLREKDMSFDQFLAEAREIRTLCGRYQVPLIINDNVELAIQCGAQGVHVGQSDMEAGHARQLGPDRILGVSARTLEEALRAEAQGADYLGVGAVFSTSTKLDAQDVSLETLKQICQRVSIPVVAIGGISTDNALLLQGSGIAGLAVVSAIFAQPDIEKAARQMRGLADRVVKA